jgi:phage gp46-like protein
MSAPAGQPNFGNLRQCGTGCRGGWTERHRDGQIGGRLLYLQDADDVGKDVLLGAAGYPRVSTATVSQPVEIQSIDVRAGCRSGRRSPTPGFLQKGRVTSCVTALADRAR